MSEIYGKIGNATKWSALTEVISKLVNPITSMVLARLLTPSAFGAVATITMIITFTEIFTDAGFQKYIIQHEFKDDDDKYKSVNVAFWSNFVMSIVFWIFIAIFSDELAVLVGSPGLGLGIIVACLAIPLQAFSSIQMALYKRSFDFKTLFLVRIVGISLPVLITIPLSIYFRNYWALVIGTLAIQISNAIILTFKSKWKPQLYYSFARLKEMLSFCVWILATSILVWMGSYIDIFFVGTVLGEHYLGLYKTSMATVGQITTIITSVVLPVMLPALSRVQNDYAEMRTMLLKFQKQTGIILIPLGVGIFIYSDLITSVLLGDQWTEASTFIGIWGLAEVVTIIIARFCSVIYPAVGKPKVSLISQILYLLVLIPGVIIAVDYGFEALYWTRSIIRVAGISLDFLFAYIIIKQTPYKMIANIFPEISCSIIMGLTCYLLLQVSDNLIYQFLTVLVGVFVYFRILFLFPNEKAVMNTLLKKIKIIK